MSPNTCSRRPRFRYVDVDARRGPRSNQRKLTQCADHCQLEESRASRQADRIRQDHQAVRDLGQSAESAVLLSIRKG